VHTFTSSICPALVLTLFAVCQTSFTSPFPNHPHSLGFPHPRSHLRHTGTIICVVLTFLLLPMAFLFLRLCCRQTPSSNSISQSSQSRRVTDTEVQAVASMPATILPPYRIAEPHSVVQSVGGQVVLTMEGGPESDGIRAQQMRALARYEDPLSSTLLPRDPRLPAVIAQERRALGRHARNDTLSTSSTSHLLAPVPTPSPGHSHPRRLLRAAGETTGIRVRIWTYGPKSANCRRRWNACVRSELRLLKSSRPRISPT
jgi:hypothetical protein